LDLVDRETEFLLKGLDIMKACRHLPIRRTGTIHHIWFPDLCHPLFAFPRYFESSWLFWFSDISRPAFDVNDKLNQLPCELAFRKSRWFARGWTLQELLAPASVKFFSKDWEQLGDKKSLERLLHVTGIPVRALQGSPLSNFSVTERLLWAEKRETTRKEDKAYSLLGIFNI
jgi:hypothetical protein